MKKNGIRRYTQSEKRGISILLSIIITVNLLSIITRTEATPNSTSIVFDEGVVEDQSYEGAEAGEEEEEDSAEVLLLEMNSADSISLLELRGIGPVFSGRIIKYRTLLGGYHDKQQLLEVYGMDSIRLSGFRASITIKSDSLRRINLRTAQFKEILRHPYISYEMVKAFVNYRDKSGPPDRIDLIWDQSIWPDSLFEKLNPYLSVGE